MQEVAPLGSCSPHVTVPSELTAHPAPPLSALQASQGPQSASVAQLMGWATHSLNTDEDGVQSTAPGAQPLDEPPVT